ncbi:DUF555 domain-containing protein [Halobaculum sp. CBA1158]|uniref:DUF555 domain-containing protein n=1 Tax=Halobaculum sp. CBA1158 TaxID=2904243 RepID=UPI001F2C58DB|nr:DUF555 domain-containing protein [Halobaculum sp. CBA1158]UIO98684.1 DUF555 domain-containing protein [Halobaculum sp. CBA1158]
MDCRVVVEAAVPVYDIETTDEAIRIAISKTGEMLNPDLNYVEISMGSRTSPEGERLPPAFVAADEALVALELEMSVFNVEREEHASRIARKEIGQRLRNIPLKVLSVEPLEDEDDGDDEDDDTGGRDSGTGGPGDGDDDSRGDGHGSTSAGDDADDDLLPEFEEMVEEER